MEWKHEWKQLVILVGFFLLCFYLPVGIPRFENGVKEALSLVKWYAREHVILCLVPAFFIAGGISVFVSQASVMKYLGATANRFIAYGVASVSGSVLAVCSCTVLPIFAGIHKRGAGLGPAIAFLYSGPAINVLAIILTARILGMDIGIARAAGAIIFSIVIGVFMHLIFRREEHEKVNTMMAVPEPEVKRPLWQYLLFFGSMVSILVFANWGKPSNTAGFWYVIYDSKWVLTSIASVVFALVLVWLFSLRIYPVLLTVLAAAIFAFLLPQQPLVPFTVGVTGLSVIISKKEGEAGEWFESAWNFAKQITPLLLGGVFIAGLLLGRPGNEGIIPNLWVTGLVGGNSLWANLFASVVGAFMYFATLTEVPIVQGLLGSGMGRGPALALLLAGPALSLPSMLVLRSVMGTKKTIVYCLLVVVMSTIIGMLFGALV